MRCGNHHIVIGLDTAGLCRKTLCRCKAPRPRRRLSVRVPTAPIQACDAEPCRVDCHQSSQHDMASSDQDMST
eukprot:613888-Rhodomonas_salina.2